MIQRNRAERIYIKKRWIKKRLIKYTYNACNYWYRYEDSNLNRIQHVTWRDLMGEYMYFRFKSGSWKSNYDMGTRWGKQKNLYYWNDNTNNRVDDKKYFIKLLKEYGIK